MSTDGTKPPSITPKKSAPRGQRTPSPRGRAASATATAAPTTEAPAVTNGASEPSGGAPGSGLPAGSTPSVGERLKRAGQSVSGSARGSARTVEAADQTAPSGTTAPNGAAGGPRRVRLAVSKIDPWSVMKLSFLLSVAVGIMIVVAAAVIWYTLDGLAVFTQVNNTIAEITGDPTFFDVLAYMAFERVIALATVIAVVDIVLLTALSTIGAFLYNIVSALVGGIHVTLTDD
jgi:hypothetical protein